MFRFAVVLDMRLGIAAASMLMASCSFAIPPVSEHSTVVPEDCTTSRVAPVLDLVGAAVVMLGGLGLWSFQCGGDEGFDGCYGDNAIIPIAGAAAAGIYVWAAVEGFQRSATCREARARMFGRSHRGDTGSDIPAPHPVAK